jgi:hypothetical protein
MTRLPRQQLLAQPLRAFVLVAEEACIGTFLLTKSQSHFSVGDVINLMGPGLEQESIHDAGHVARNASAALGVGEMVGMRRRHGIALEASVASHAHKIGPVPEFQRRRVRSRIVVLLTMVRSIMRVWIVASATAQLSFPEAL